MPRVTCTNPVAPVYVVLLGRVVEAGETIDVTADQAKELLAQIGNWTIDKSGDK